MLGKRKIDQLSEEPNVWTVKTTDEDGLREFQLEKGVQEIEKVLTLMKEVSEKLKIPNLWDNYGYREYSTTQFIKIQYKIEDLIRCPGRLRTNRSLGVAFDEGASWIHGIDGNPITALAEQAGMKTAFSDDESILSYDLNQVLRSDTEYADAEEEFYFVLETLKNKGKADQSFESVFNALYPNKSMDRLWKFFLSSYLTFDTGDLDKLSSLLIIANLPG